MINTIRIKSTITLGVPAGPDRLGEPDRLVEPGRLADLDRLAGLA